MKSRIVITRRMTPAVIDRAKTEFDAIAPDTDMDVETIVNAVNDHKAEALFFTAGTKLDAKLIERLPASVKVAATCSVGIDHIDLAAAKARGLIVTNTPNVLTNATADFAFMLILGASRRAAEYDQTMRRGWQRYFGMAEMLGKDVSGKRLGIIGYGRIGQAVARRARGFDMTVLCHSRNKPNDLSGAEYFADYRDMLPLCDILSLHAPGQPGGTPIMDREAFALLPRGAIFVNTGRGSLVDEDALYDALVSKQIYAAGLDVFAKEPAFDKRFAELPNTFLAPHMASATEETRTAMGYRTLDNIAAVLKSGRAIDPVG